MTGKRLYWFPDISILLLIRDLVRFNYLIIGKNRIDYRILASIFRITSVMVIFTDVTRYSFILGQFCKKNSMFLTISQIKWVPLQSQYFSYQERVECLCNIYISLIKRVTNYHNITIQIKAHECALCIYRQTICCGMFPP